MKSAFLTADWQFHRPTEKEVTAEEVCWSERRLPRLRCRLLRCDLFWQPVTTEMLLWHMAMAESKWKKVYLVCEPCFGGLVQVDLHVFTQKGLHTKRVNEPVRPEEACHHKMFWNLIYLKRAYVEPPLSIGKYGWTWIVRATRNWAEYSWRTSLDVKWRSLLATVSLVNSSTALMLDSTWFPLNSTTKEWWQMTPILDESVVNDEWSQWTKQMNLFLRLSSSSPISQQFWHTVRTS